MKNKQTEFIGFRTEKETKEEIEKIAEKQDISVSKLMNRTLKQIIQNEKK